MSKETKWSIDQTHSGITFKVRHLMIAHIKGSFKTFDASIYTNHKDFLSSKVDFWIDPASIDTGDETRDTHLRSAEFFDVANHKQITFVSTTLTALNEEGKLEIWGDLTIKGITKRVKLEAQYGGIAIDPWGKEKAGFSITLDLIRTDWGLIWNKQLDAGGFMLGEDIAITCDLELVNTSKEEQTMNLEPTQHSSSN